MIEPEGEAEKLYVGDNFLGVKSSDYYGYEVIVQKRLYLDKIMKATENLNVHHFVKYEGDVEGIVVYTLKKVQK